MELINPDSLAKPVAAFSHGVVVPAGYRVLHTSGTVATRLDGSIADTVGEQAADIWRHLDQICRASGMTLQDAVSYTTYVVAGQDLAPVMAARDHALAGHAAASTLIVVPALARPQWLLEITLVAAAAQ